MAVSWIAASWWLIFGWLLLRWLLLPFSLCKTPFTLRRLLTYTPSCCFQGLSWASSSASKRAEPHADHWNIALTRLLLGIPEIHKRGILVSSIDVPKAFYVVRVPQLWNLPLTGFEPALLKVACVNNRWSWQLAYRVLWVLINK